MNIKKRVSSMIKNIESKIKSKELTYRHKENSQLMKELKEIENLHGVCEICNNLGDAKNPASFILSMNNTRIRGHKQCISKVRNENLKHVSVSRYKREF